MEQEDKELLLIKELYARAPYRTKVSVGYWEIRKGKPKLVWYERLLTPFLLHDIEDNDAWEYIKPYLRALSSMTEEEKKEYKHLVAFSGSSIGAANFVDWLNKHHFDYRGLIEKGLAIEVTKENNPYEN